MIWIYKDLNNRILNSSKLNHSQTMNICRHLVVILNSRFLLYSGKYKSGIERKNNCHFSHFCNKFENSEHIIMIYTIIIVSWNMNCQCLTFHFCQRFDEIGISGEKPRLNLFVDIGGKDVLFRKKLYNNLHNTRSSTDNIFSRLSFEKSCLLLRSNRSLMD